MPSGPKSIRDTRAGVGLRHEQVANVAQRFAVPAAARERERAFVVREALVIREVHVLVVAEARMQRHLEQAGAAQRFDLGHARDGLGIEDAAAHDAQAAVRLRHEPDVVRQERNAPGMRDAACDDRHADSLPFGRRILDGAIGQRRYRHLGRHGNAVGERHVLLRVAGARGSENERGETDAPQGA